MSINTLVRCTTVCKYWNSLIKDPTFISTHLKLTTTASSFAVSTTVTAATNVSRGHEKSFRVADSINGIVCLIGDHDYVPYYYLLWNPSIQKSITVPRPNLTSMGHAFVGFGYDSRNDDYKLVRMVPPNDPKGLNSGAQLEIFSLKSSSWKTLSGPICHKYMTIASSSQAFVNGVVHWIARRDGDSLLNYVLLGLDMSNEVLHETILPEEFRIQLLIFVTGNDLKSLHTARPLWISKKGEELIAESLDGDLIAVDLQNRHVKCRQVLGTPEYTFIGPYVESLVLLNTIDGYFVKILE
ncbi:hypothetical protein JCGZ_00794 [Jatropha curcas]|uniref:F-box associated beta-propeller type 1 domain-containing protein n=1 Tax=Jatropha curcas TaxID=180498 RepID=A0A067KSC2_JATCU|nr:hypothetical protein JCGZ_00794 [Jatropha curcas]